MIVVVAVLVTHLPIYAPAPSAPPAARTHTALITSKLKHDAENRERLEQSDVKTAISLATQATTIAADVSASKRDRWTEIREHFEAAVDAVRGLAHACGALAKK